MDECINFLFGRAVKARLPHLPISKPFKAEFSCIFDYPIREADAASGQLSLRQGAASVTDYSIQFRILAVNSGWNDAALRVVYLKGLREQQGMSWQAEMTLPMSRP